MAIFNEQYQDAGDFFGLRQEYRKRNLERVRRDNGLPVPELFEGRMVYRDADGNARPWAVSIRRGPKIEEVEGFWFGTPEITHLPIASDGVPISKELDDLDRDARQFESSERVSFGAESEPAPDFTVSDINSEAEVDAALQGFIARHE